MLLMILYLALLTISYINTEGRCVDKAPIWCHQHKMHCHTKWIESFQKFCAKSCGYCDAPTAPPPTLGSGETHPPYKGKCGLPEVRGARVIAGSTPTRGRWPWQVLLLFRDFANCGGSLISSQHVVTAAHCVYEREHLPHDYVVRVGEHNRSRTEGSEDEVLVGKIFRHPGYNPHTLDNDIALLKLESPVKMNKFVQPVCLPSKNAPIGSECYVTGWGKTHHPGIMSKVLQQGMLQVISNPQCNAKNLPSIHIAITSSMICGGPSGRSTRTSACHGDSGDPYVCRSVDGRWELQGSVSHGSPTCDVSQTYTVFSRTFHFNEWIKKTMAHY